MLQASVIANNGNSNLRINGIIGRYFRLQIKDNSTPKLNGSIDKPGHSAEWKRICEVQKTSRKRA